MPPAPPFPHPFVAWVYFGILAAALVAAAVIDGRTRRIPKLLSVGLAPVGLLMNAVRGGGLAGNGEPVWMLRHPVWWQGAGDGLLFGLAGLLTAFCLFFLLWALGTCGGGDVKLFASIGAWIGPNLAVKVLAGTIAIVAAIVVFRLLRRTWQKPSGPAATTRDRLVTFSFPLALATFATLGWTHAGEFRGTPLQPLAGEASR